MFYSFLVYLHVLSAVVSVGPFFVLFPLIRRIRHAAEADLVHYLPQFAAAVRLTKHAGHILVATGVLLIWLGPWQWLTPFVLLTILTMVASLVFLARAFSPTLKKLREPHTDRTPMVNKLRRSLILYVTLLLVMLWFMVAKPAWW